MRVVRRVGKALYIVMGFALIVCVGVVWVILSVMDAVAARFRLWRRIWLAALIVPIAFPCLFFAMVLRVLTGGTVQLEDRIVAIINKVAP